MRKNTLALLAAGLVAFAGAASAADVSDTFTIELTVENACDVGAQDYAGSVSGTSAESGRTNAGAINVYCNFGTAYSVSIDQGWNFGLGVGAGGENRRSLAGGLDEFISYDIFQDPDMLIPWGEDAFAVAGVGTGLWQQYDYHLTFYNPNLVTQGTYIDTLAVTVTYND